MRNTGLRNPVRNSIIALAICLGGVIAILAGVAEMNALGAETTRSAVLIGVGIVVAVIGLAVLVNFLRGVKVVKAIERGRNEIARWTVSAAEFDAFRESDAQRNALGPEYRNNYGPPRTTTPEGVEVIFVPDGVLVGGTYFGLITTGMFTFRGVQVLPGNPMSIEFGTVMTSASNLSTVQIHHDVASLRIPIARTATEGAKRVLAHFQDVDARTIIVNSHLWPRGIRIGLYGALACVLVAAAGFGLEAIEADLAELPLIMAVVGAVGAVGGLVFAFLAWAMMLKQRQGG
jgi:hypothetical protein